MTPPSSREPGFKVKGWNLHLVQGLSWVDAYLRAGRLGGCAGLDGPLLRTVDLMAELWA